MEGFLLFILKVLVDIAIIVIALEVFTRMHGMQISGTASASGAISA